MLDQQIIDSSIIEEIIENGNLIQFIGQLNQCVQRTSGIGESFSKYANYCIEYTKFDQYKLIFQLYNQKYGNQRIVNFIDQIKRKLFEQHRFKILVYTIQQFPLNEQTRKTQFLNELLYFSTLQDKYTSMRYLLSLGADPKSIVEKSTALDMVLQRAKDYNDRKPMNLILMKAQNLKLDPDQKIIVQNYEPKWYNYLFTQSIFKTSPNIRKYLFSFLIILNSILWVFNKVPCQGLIVLLISWAVINLILHTYLCLVDPGLKKLEIDVNLIIMSDINEDQICVECKRLVEKSTVHCDRCEVCVEGRSHHCIWIDRCVGKSNTYAFKCSLFMFSVYFLASPIFATYCMLPSQDCNQTWISKGGIDDLGFKIAVMILGYLITLIQIIQCIRIGCSRSESARYKESKKRIHNQNTHFDTSQLINNDNVN